VQIETSATALSARLGLVTLLLALACPRSLAAQEIAVDGFRPAASPHGIFGVRGSEVSPAPYFGLTLQYGNDLLVVRQGSTTVARPLQDRLVGELGLAAGLFERLELAVALPVALWQRGDGLPPAGAGFEGTALGDLRLAAFGQLLRPATATGFGVALGAEVTLPTHGDLPWTGELDPTVAPTLIVQRRFAGGALVAANLAFLVRPEAEFLDLTFDDEVRLGLGGELPIGGTGLGLLGELTGALGLGEAAEVAGGTAAQRFPVEALGGLRWRSCSGWLVTGGIGYGVLRGYGSPDLRGVFALGFAPGGLGSPARRCPSAGPAAAAPATPVTPTPPPPPPPAPATAASFDQWVAEDQDRDGDGLLPPADRCPDQPEDRDGFADEDGCPDPDNDGDGVLDGADRCPTEKETINGVADDDGCPDQGESRVRVTTDKVEILDRVYFDTAKDTLQERSFGILRQVATTLKAHPEIRRVRVEGHTDNQGDPEMNVDLSERRARRVAEFLLGEGVPPDQLESRGYGAKVPIDSNKTTAGRANNRRVEFLILEGAGSSAVQDPQGASR